MTVRQATAVIRRAVEDERVARHLSFTTSAMGPPHSEEAFAAGLRELDLRRRWVWRYLPVANEFKEIWWRLAVDGVVGAHSDLQGWMRGECGCGAVGCSDLRLHHFWACPIAQVVVNDMQRVLGQGGFIERRHVWLLLSPSHECTKAIWSAVGLAALHAMNVGRRLITKRFLEAREALPEDRGPWVEEVGFHAVTAFWSRLGRMLADLQCLMDRGEFEEQEWRWGHAQHPFIALDNQRFRLSGQPE